MKKRELSPIELKKVVELRQLGAKWTEIQRETNVDRRASKRAYEEWERDKEVREQEAVRFRVAAEAFHEHLNDLIRLAESLIDTLQVPEILRGLDSADVALNQLWMRNMQGESEQFSSSTHKGERLVRRNKMLFKSLQEHTRERVRWECLEEWKQARNSAFEYSKKLRLQTIDVINSILNNRADLKERLIIAIGSSDIHEKISDGVRETIWQSILTGEPDQMHVRQGAGSVNMWKVWLEFYKGDEKTKLDLNDLELVKEALSVCHETITKLREETTYHLLQGLADQAYQMRERAKELEESLDVLILRPIILRTRCEICPA